MASTRVRCGFCGMQRVVPPYAHAIQCLACESIINFQPDDPLCQGHSPIFRGTSRVNDIRRSSSNIDKMAATINKYSESGAPGSGGYDPQQARPSPSLVPVSAHGRKRAVLCGVSYYGQKYRLKGTVNDVKCMKYFLTQKYGFPSDSILVLTEEESDPLRMPTKLNIRNAMQWLVQGCQSGDSLVFLFSGHGSQQLDYTGDEIDGYDEMLWPVDHQTEGTIVDDEINATIVRPLPRGATLHAIIDACHSGTILDLPFLCRMNRNGYYMWEDHRTQAAYKGTSGGLALSLSACDDHQVSVDTTALTGKFATGAMTYSFIEAAQSEPGLTYGRLLNAMRQTIFNSSKRMSQNGPASLLKNVKHHKLPQPQEPQLSSSEQFDVYTKKFVL